MSLFKEKCFPATQESLPEVLAWVEEQSMELLPMALAMRLQLAAEEAIVNVVNYAYGEDSAERPLLLRLGQDASFYLEVEDRGAAFNPLENIKADATAALEDRTAGGWGRPLIIKMTSAAIYERRDGANVLRLEEDPADPGNGDMLDLMDLPE